MEEGTSIRPEKTGDSEMEKIKRNMKIEKSIRFAKLMCLMDHSSPKGQLDDWIKEYKESEWEDKTFDDKDVDLMIEALESLPGYSVERFLLTGIAFGAIETKLENVELLDLFLQMTYTFLSMVNPDLFKGEAFDGRIDIKD